MRAECIRFTHICPLGESLDVLVPGNLHADRIPLHPVEVRILGGGAVKEFAPEKLAVQRERWHRFLYLQMEKHVGRYFRRN